MTPKILLLVNSDPAGSGIGELFLREIGKTYPAGRLVRYSTVQKRKKVDAENWLGFKSYTRYVSASRWPLFSSAHEWLFSLARVNEMVNEIAAIIEKEKIDIVWSVLSSGPIISLTKQVMARSQVPVVSTILDDPQYFAKNQHIDFLTWRHMHAHFSHVLKRSLRVSVISESMQSIYRARYGIESIVMRHGVHESCFQKWIKNKSSDSVIRIGFAGSIYAKKEWNALLKMLESTNGRIAGKEVRISFIGRMPRTGVSISRFVDNLGHMSFESVIDSLKQTDIAYLPYWFDPRHAVTVKTSFPGKLSTYAACGIPVFYHGPKNSSVTQFFQEYKFGVCCHSLAESEILLAIVKILEDDDFNRQASAARDAALENELGRSAMLRRFCELINCNPAGFNQLFH